jgi:hypothetical protein
VSENSSPPSSGRFKAQVRHYHRTSKPRSNSWNEWVHGKDAPRRPPIFRFEKAIALTLLIAALIAAAVYFF